MSTPLTLSTYLAIRVEILIAILFEITVIIPTPVKGITTPTMYAKATNINSNIDFAFNEADINIRRTGNEHDIETIP